MVSTRTDALGEPFTAETIPLPDDAEGPVVATLVKRPASAPTTRAVLYVHGFSDYFFHVHVAELFNELGYDFYALDLRKYGPLAAPTPDARFLHRPDRLRCRAGCRAHAHHRARRT
jgi:hypothetical protein